PPFKGITYVLWLGPAVLLTIAGAGLVIVARRRRKAAPPEGLSEDEKHRLAQLLDDGGEG
ncbi:MAG: cytochrome c-type biogenesis protein CcmH, partial [Alphaproteobacteria bacterium]|nr:cytochrome c-type biogenesis protein CcmH [Alphaproteobacteria bacterium]